MWLDLNEQATNIMIFTIREQCTELDIGSVDFGTDFEVLFTLYNALQCERFWFWWDHEVIYALKYLP